MPYFNIDTQKARTYDAIVIGSGISSGWAAKELTEKGLRTLVLERGRFGLVWPRTHSDVSKVSAIRYYKP